MVIWLVFAISIHFPRDSKYKIQGHSRVLFQVLCYAMFSTLYHLSHLYIYAQNYSSIHVKVSSMSEDSVTNFIIRDATGHKFLGDSKSISVNTKRYVYNVTKMKINIQKRQVRHIRKKHNYYT